ncbi:DUF2510 domain-containing protein [Streptomyces sp. CC219B]|uniref:DUF2510 domain-containing protein n=1 Tax=Streptomyces sp. CC219B TaxID=3044574 RepID=UPI0024A914F7|nr:DUF2510 domain-containing protein [Streptomyces sp. CC219B]
MTPPPGWYRDPHAPHLERWWDGTAWTEHRRAPEVAGPPVPGPPSAGGPASGRAKAVALTTAGVVLVAAIVTGAVALRSGDDTDGAQTDTGPTYYTAPPTTEPPTTEPTSPTTEEPSADDPAVVVDELNGITLPLPEGWVRPKYVSESDVVMTTDGTYDCPGDGGFCHRGRVVSRTMPTSGGETSPETLAKRDIPEAADAAYDRDLLDKRPYGGIESHELVKSGPVAVAGRAGYFVRWRVRTAEGPGGYVQSTVFPSRVGTESPVCVRYYFDAGADGPPLSDMDLITKGIRSVSDPDGGGGVGNSVGPDKP